MDQNNSYNPAGSSGVGYNNYAQQAQYRQPSQNYPQSQSNAPVGQLKTNRSFLKVFLLSLITFGIYGIVAYSSATNDLNIIASRYDGKKTMHYCLLIFIVAPLTLGIGALVWSHKISDRIGNELRRRNISYNFSAGTFWLWCVLGSLLFGIGPIVYAVKFFFAMNLLSENYNTYG